MKATQKSNQPRLLISRLGIAVAVTAITFGSLLPSQAGDGPARSVNTAEASGNASSVSAVQLLERAAGLAAYARANESATAMLAALEMLGRVRYQELGQLAGTKMSVGPGETTAAAEVSKHGVGATLDADALVAEAKGWAAGDTALVALLEQQGAKAKAGPRVTLGATGGATTHRDRVLKRTADNYNLRFRGGERARVAVIGDGDTDLDLVVEDENGNVVAQDMDLTDNCVVEWTPRWTGTFHVRVINNGNLFNNYLLLTN